MKVNTRREKFFDVSLKLIHRKGFKATTLRDIAEQLDFEVANVYNYIDSKQSLLEKYLEDIEQPFLKEAEYIFTSTLSAKKKLRYLISLHVKLASKNPYEVSLLNTEWKHLRDDKLTGFKQRRFEYKNKIKAVIEEGIETNELKSMNPDIAVNMFLASVRWVYTQYIKAGEKSINPFELEKNIAEILFDGLG